MFIPGCKKQCGMGDYQARGWQVRHHFMSMVMLAMVILLEQRLAYQADSIGGLC